MCSSDLAPLPEATGRRTPLSDKWSNPVPDSGVLRPVASGKGALAVGVSAGFYVADHPGQARVTAFRGSAHFEVDVSVK